MNIIPKFKLEFERDQIASYQDMVTEILTADRPISNGHFVRQFEHDFKSEFVYN